MSIFSNPANIARVGVIPVLFVDGFVLREFPRGVVRARRPCVGIFVGATAALNPHDDALICVCVQLFSRPSVCVSVCPRVAVECHEEASRRVSYRPFVSSVVACARANVCRDDGTSVEPE